MTLHRGDLTSKYSFICVRRRTYLNGSSLARIPVRWCTLCELMEGGTQPHLGTWGVASMSLRIVLTLLCAEIIQGVSLDQKFKSCCCPLYLQYCHLPVLNKFSLTVGSTISITHHVGYLL